LRTRRNAAVLALSLAAHAALLAAWMSTRPDLRLAEPPTMQVALVQLPPRAKAPSPPREPRRADTRVLSRPAQALEPRPVQQPPEPPPDVAPAPISPEWRVKPQPPLVLNLPRKEFRRPPCKSSEDHSDWDGPPCARGSPDDQAARWDAARDSGAGAFEGAGRYKRAEKRYHEAPGAAGYPGIRCAIFHQC
jgi:hypothetical protein